MTVFNVLLKLPNLCFQFSDLFFQLFDVPSILAYTIAFIFVVQVIEFSVFVPWERRANRWRA